MGRITRLIAAIAVASSTTLVVARATSRADAATTSPPGCGVATGSTWRMVSTSPSCRVVVPVGPWVPLTLSSHFRWSAIHSTSNAVRTESARPATGGLRGALRGDHAGVATLSASGGVVCPAGQPCPALVVLWRLTVFVVARSSHPVSVPVGVSDTATTLTLRRGDVVAVRLAGSNLYTWSVPRADTGGVLARGSPGPGRATFTALRTGSSTVSSVDTPNCYPACLMPSRLWRLRVVVTG